jgi:cobalt/nickel transport system permease protein
LVLLWLKFRRARNLVVFARAGFFAALMVVAMSFHVAPLGYHLNLAALAGIVAGPAAALLACVFANVILALLGHGGITVIGLNTVTMGAEAVGAFAVFRVATFIKATWPRAFAATIAALAVGTTLAFGVVALGTRDFGDVVDRGRGGVTFELFDGHAHQEEHPADESRGDVSRGRLAALFYGLGSIGWVLEALVTATVAAYLKRAAPRLFGEAT